MLRNGCETKVVMSADHTVFIKTEA